MTCHVVFLNGDEADYTSKVTIKWTSLTKKYTYEVGQIEYPVVYDANTKKYYSLPTVVVTVKGNGQPVTLEESDLNMLDSRYFSGTGITEDGKLTLTLQEHLKKGTYSTNVRIVTTDHEYVNSFLDSIYYDIFGITFKVSVKVNSDL